MKIQSTAIKALFSKFCLVLFIASGTWVLTACDNQRIAELEEGVATEADVRIKFGEPEKFGTELMGHAFLNTTANLLAPRTT